MFATLRRTASIVAGVDQHIAKTVIGLMVGTITDPAQINSTFFDTANSSIVEGSYPMNTPWTLVYDNTNASTTTGYAILTHGCQNGIPKTNFLKIFYNPSYLQFFTGSGLNTDSTDLVNLTTAATGVYARATSLDLSVRYSDTFVHTFNPGISAYHEAMAFEFNPNPYDAYSAEASMKAFHYTSTPAMNLYQSVAYNPATDSYVLTKTHTIPYNISLARLASIGVSRAEDLGNNLNLLVPIIFNDLDNGALLGNISESTGLYLTTSGNIISGQTILVGSDTYAVGANTLTDLVTLAKI